MLPPAPFRACAESHSTADSARVARAQTFAVPVDAESGERRAFDRSSSVPLTDGVAASCAAPGISPPITIEGRPTGSSSLPKPRKPPSSVVALDVAVEALPAKGAQVSP